jgi:hypothetical protein
MNDHFGSIVQLASTQARDPIDVIAGLERRTKGRRQREQEFTTSFEVVWELAH